MHRITQQLAGINARYRTQSHRDAEFVKAVTQAMGLGLLDPHGRSYIQQVGKERKEGKRGN